MNIFSTDLKFFESDGHTHLLALFHEESTDRAITVTVHQDHMLESTQIFIDSTSITAGLIHLHGMVVSGSIKLYADHNVHAH